MKQRSPASIEVRVTNNLTECIECLVRIRDHVARQQPMPAGLVENGIEQLALTLCLVIAMQPVKV